MQPPPHLVPEPFSGQDGKKRYGNDGAGGQDDGGPGQVQRRSQEAADEKFDGNAQHSQANEYIEGGRQEGRGKFPAQECDEDAQQGNDSCNRKRQFIEPGGVRGIEGD